MGENLMASNINDLLQQDGVIDQLSDAEVRDVWARSTLAKLAFRAGEWHANERHFTAMLAEGPDGDLWNVAEKAFGRQNDVKRALRPDTDESFNANTLFDRWTKDEAELSGDYSLEDVAREKLKTTLRGSGMPRMKVARRRANHLADN